MDGARQVAGGHVVEHVGTGFVGFGLVHGRVGRAVHHAVYAVGFDESFHGIFVRDVEFLHVGEEVIEIGMSGGQELHLVAQLSVTSGDEDILHIYMLSFVGS